MHSWGQLKNIGLAVQLEFDGRKSLSCKGYFAILHFEKIRVFRGLNVFKSGVCACCITWPQSIIRPANIHLFQSSSLKNLCSRRTFFFPDGILPLVECPIAGGPIQYLSQKNLFRVIASGHPIKGSIPCPHRQRSSVHFVLFGKDFSCAQIKRENAELLLRKFS